MTLQQLEYILALDNQKTVVRAAASCFVTQPTLSMQIQKLEDEIGFKIFDRSKKPMSPTLLGNKFIQKSRRIMYEVNVLKAQVSGEIESVTGKFRVGIIPTLAPYLLPRFLPQFIVDYPKTILTIEEIRSEQIIRSLEAGMLDIGFLSTPLDENFLREIPMFRESFLVYLPEGHALLDRDRIQPGELKSDDLLLLSEGHCFRKQALHICSKDKAAVHKNFEYQSGSIETIKRLVQERMGYTLVPELSVLEESKTNPNIRHFEVPEPVREISIVCHVSFPREKLLENLKSSVLAGVPDSFQKNEHYVRVKWR
jgi:LysR family hydrogen peroxide-inducible transcriptional activator